MSTRFRMRHVFIVVLHLFAQITISQYEAWHFESADLVQYHYDNYNTRWIEIFSTSFDSNQQASELTLNREASIINNELLLHISVTDNPAWAKINISSVHTQNTPLLLKFKAYRIPGPGNEDHCHQWVGMKNAEILHQTESWRFPGT